jgi:polyisoprenyl-phosphate glycosyltransferase
LALVSIIIPVHNEQENIRLVCDEIATYITVEYEILFVDDGSRDNTFLEIQQQSTVNERIRCISLSRNFGHQNALMAGMQHVSGEYIVTMDGDLQHPPALIPRMLEQLNNGYDLVATIRSKTSNTGPVKRFFATLFYKFINAISDTHIEPNAADFRAFNKKILGAVLQFSEREVFLRGLFSWIGFKTTTIEFEAPKRRFGKTKYSFAKMMKFALRGTTSFSFRPLRVAFIVGAFISAAAFAFAVYALIAYLNNNTVPGWASTIIAIMFLGGTQLLAIGLLGEYIASLFVETKRRPLYLIDKKINL